MTPNPLPRIVGDLPRRAAVLDVGCLHFRIARLCVESGRSDLLQAGTDFMNLAPDAPPESQFRQADLSREPIPFADDAFELVVASHIIEHLPNAVEFAGELVRVTKPGGLIYVEAPSERALWLPSMPYQHDRFFSLNFFDDPTHQLRPSPPQALHRLFRYLACEIDQTGYYVSRRIRYLLPFYLLKAWRRRSGQLLETYLWQAIGWSAFAVIHKPASLQGKPRFNYYIPENR